MAVSHPSPYRVLSRIYRLGERSQEKSLEADGMHPPEIFGNKYVLRCILRHNCVLRQGILTSRALTSLRLDDFSDIVTYILLQ